MKLVINGGTSVEVVGQPSLGSSVSIPVADISSLPSPVEGVLVLTEEIYWPVQGPVEGDEPEVGPASQFELYKTNTSDWLRVYTSGNRLILTNVPEPEPPTPPTEEEIEAERLRVLNETKERMIAESNSKLEVFLEEHPLTWLDGNQYSVTEKKQSLLTSNIALYQLSVQAGEPRELKWNTTGEVCVTWTIENLSALALAIGDYVQPFVTHQQTLEVKIRESGTIEELNEIVIEYESVLEAGNEEQDS